MARNNDGGASDADGRPRPVPRELALEFVPHCSDDDSKPPGSSSSCSYFYSLAIIDDTECKAAITECVAEENTSLLSNLRIFCGGKEIKLSQDGAKTICELGYKDGLAISSDKKLTTLVRIKALQV